MGRFVPFAVGGLFAISVFTGCETTKSSNPLSPAVAGPIAGVNITAPVAFQPGGGAQIATDQQPVTLTIQNAQTNGVRPIQYTFEVASTAAFADDLVMKTGVAPGSDGHTSYQLAELLPTDHTYYWRSKADDGANASGFSDPVSFHVYTPVVIEPPNLTSPADGSEVSSLTPSLVLTNSTRTGPAGAIQYLFTVATDAAMTSKVASTLVAETAGQTTYTLSAPLAYGTHYYWQAQAFDPSHQSGNSATRSFVTPAPPSVPAPPPPPAGGGSGGGTSPAAPDAINMRAATILNSPSDLGSWPVTTSITALDLRPSGVHVEFSKQDGGDRWPDVTPPGWNGSLQYTLGMCLNISGQWYCSAPIEFWYGLSEAGGPPSQYALNWFYDPARWGPMSGHQPAVGESIGFFVCEGDCRNSTDGSLSPLRERSNVVVVSMPGNAGGSFRF